MEAARLVDDFFHSRHFFNFIIFNASLFYRATRRHSSADIFASISRNADELISFYRLRFRYHRRDCLPRISVTFTKINLSATSTRHHIRRDGALSDGAPLFRRGDSARANYVLSPDDLAPLNFDFECSFIE